MCEKSIQLNVTEHWLLMPHRFFGSYSYRLVTFKLTSPQKRSFYCGLCLHRYFNPCSFFFNG